MTRRSNAPGGRAVIRPYVEPGVLSPGDFERPVFEFDRRLSALERAFYRHILRVIDLDALFSLEQRLWSAASTTSIASAWAAARAAAPSTRAAGGARGHAGAALG